MCVCVCVWERERERERERESKRERERERESECVLTKPSELAGCETRSIFKGSWTGLNSVYFFSLAGCQTKAE